MFRWLGVALLLLCPAVSQASLFEDKDKDAESQLVMGVAKDRKVTQVENVRNIELAEDYLLEKMERVERKLNRTSKRLDKLEAELRELRARLT
ncbi:MAG: hypothetical protein HY714_03500 [Candidatus Omnitrophica bacterium]|nr:hypothetical protein [Candidatus Omnitrophota bacterium]